ncbi:MAG: RNA methyltransferase, partial [Actinomyces sp.]
MAATTGPSVVGARHPRVRALRRLLARRGAGAPVVLEGPRTVGEALDAAWSLETVVAPADAVERHEVAAVLDRLDDAVEVLVVRPEVFGRLAPTVTPQP